MALFLRRALSSTVILSRFPPSYFAASVPPAPVGLLRSDGVPLFPITRGLQQSSIEGRRTFAMGQRSNSNFPCAFKPARYFSVERKQLPHIADPDIEVAFKDLIAMSWDEIPDSVSEKAKTSLSKATDDKTGQEVLANAFRAAVASVEFGGVLVSLRMALDDLSGLTGENVDRLPKDLEEAMKAAYKRYTTYLDSFGPDEYFLRKKVETELGTKMIHLKMRCSGIGSEWGTITLIGTSGLSGSYVEQRA